jgi:hypothetical protein
MPKICSLYFLKVSKFVPAHVMSREDRLCSIPSMTKFTLTAITTQSGYYHPSFLAAVRLGFRSCQVNVGSYHRRSVGIVVVNLEKTERRLLHLKAQSVPRCKHFSSRL